MISGLLYIVKKNKNFNFNRKIFNLQSLLILEIKKSDVPIFNSELLLIIEEYLITF